MDVMILVFIINNLESISLQTGTGRNIQQWCGQTQGAVILIWTKKSKGSAAYKITVLQVLFTFFLFLVIRGQIL